VQFKARLDVTEGSVVEVRVEGNDQVQKAAEPSAAKLRAALGCAERRGAQSRARGGDARRGA
jgi:hypothetical protein